jgi:formylglycine-generating enzyme required for sulfatase activity
LFLPAFYIDRNLVTAREYAKFIHEKGPTGPKGEMFLDVADPDALVQKSRRQVAAQGRF